MKLRTVKDLKGLYANYTNFAKFDIFSSEVNALADNFQNDQWSFETHVEWGIAMFLHRLQKEQGEYVAFPD